MPDIPAEATEPAFSRDFVGSGFLHRVLANVTRVCRDAHDLDSCGCDRDDPFLRYDCPRGWLSCGCYRCPESLGTSFHLHEGFCYEGCPVDTGFRPAFFDMPPAAASTAVMNQKLIVTVLSPKSVPTPLGDMTLYKTCDTWCQCEVLEKAFSCCRKCFYLQQCGWLRVPCDRPVPLR